LIFLFTLEPALSSMKTDAREAGVRVGMVFSLVSFSTLTGPPIAGVLVQRAGVEYHYAFAFAGTCLFLGTAIGIAYRVSRVDGF
jgi:MFS family permease